jgi:hypothetical protein
VRVQSPLCTEPLPCTDIINTFLKIKTESGKTNRKKGGKEDGKEKRKEERRGERKERGIVKGTY